VRIVLRNPRREVELAGPMTVQTLLARLEVNPESVLVIVGDELVTRDVRLDDAAQVEIRPVVSGGSGSHTPS
jgi:sulfur carrier protein